MNIDEFVRTGRARVQDLHVAVRADSEFFDGAQAGLIQAREHRTFDADLEFDIAPPVHYVAATTDLQHALAEAGPGGLVTSVNPRRFGGAVQVEPHSFGQWRIHASVVADRVTHVPASSFVGSLEDLAPMRVAPPKRSDHNATDTKPSPKPPRRS